MRLDVDRICELAGIGRSSRDLVVEGVAPVASAVKSPIPAPVTSAKPPVATSSAVKAEDEVLSEDEMDIDSYELSGGEPDWYGEEELYEINEEELAEALVQMRQDRLDEAHVRDIVKNEIARALSDKSASWIYGADKPTNSRPGQVVRGGFGVGFKR